MNLHTLVGADQAIRTASPPGRRSDGRPRNVFLVVAWLLWASTAESDMARVEICNAGTSTLRIAEVFESLVSPSLHGRWIAHGWLFAERGQCVSVNQASLGAPAFLHFSHRGADGRFRPATLRAATDDGRVFSVSRQSFCVPPGGEFRRTGSREELGNCPRGWETVPFPLSMSPGWSTNYTLSVSIDVPRDTSSDVGAPSTPYGSWKVRRTRITNLDRSDLLTRTAEAIRALESIRWPTGNGSPNSWGRTWQRLLEERSYPEFSTEELRGLYRNAELELEVLPRETFADCRDRFLAYQILHLAGVKGDPAAQLRLGEMWEADGDCWPSNRYLAEYWHRKAALQGHAEVRNHVRR